MKLDNVLGCGRYVPCHHSQCHGMEVSGGMHAVKSSKATIYGAQTHLRSYYLLTWSALTCGHHETDIINQQSLSLEG